MCAHIAQGLENPGSFYFAQPCCIIADRVLDEGRDAWQSAARLEPAPFMATHEPVKASTDSRKARRFAPRLLS